MENPIKRILVPLDPSLYADAATRTACRIAKKHGAEIGGVAVLDSSDITSSMVPEVSYYYPSTIDAVQKKKDHAGRILDDCMTRFADTCEREKIEHFEKEWEGLPSQKLLESSIFFDLVVIGLETFFHFEAKDEKGDRGRNLTELLDRTITPVLAVPAKGMNKFERVLIAFDGSLSSARALQDFSRFAQPFDFEITVFVGEKEKREAGFLLSEAEAFLGAHGHSNVNLQHETEPIKNCLEQKDLESFDLVVAGIHSKRIIKDFFVGSFTKRLIEMKSTPLFLSH